MVSKAQRKTKKAIGNKTKQAARKVAKKGTRSKIAKKVANQTAKKAGSKKANSAKKSSRKKATGRKGVASVDELDKGTLLLADTPKSKAKAPKKKAGPKTPSVPRAVKPVPKVANTELGPELLEFIAAIERYKQEYCRPFPTWREVFYLLMKLGYRREEA